MAASKKPRVPKAPRPELRVKRRNLTAQQHRNLQEALVMLTTAPAGIDEGLKIAFARCRPFLQSWVVPKLEAVIYRPLAGE